jgi:hypothetical protein
MVDYLTAKIALFGDVVTKRNAEPKKKRDARTVGDWVYFLS